MLQSRYYTIKKPIVIILLSMFGRKAEPSMIPGRRGSWSERLTNWVAVTLAVELKGNEESALLVVLQDWNGKRMHLGTLCATHEKTRSESGWLRGTWVVLTSCMPCKRSSQLSYTPIECSAFLQPLLKRTAKIDACHLSTKTCPNNASSPSKSPTPPG